MRHLTKVMHEKRQKAINLLALLAWLVVAFLPGVVGGLFQPGDWFTELQKPTWQPPAWIFGPVWTLLYILMGFAAWVVWLQRRSRPIAIALALFLVQLVLNGLWSWLFFGLHRIDLALLDIVALVVLLLATAVAFGRVQRTAGWLLVPYLAWVVFAAALNASIWLLNR